MLPSRLRPMLLIAALSVAAAACGSEGSADSPTATTGAAVPTSAPAVVTSVTTPDAPADTGQAPVPTEATNEGATTAPPSPATDAAPTLPASGTPAPAAFCDIIRSFTTDEGNPLASFTPDGNDPPADAMERFATMKDVLAEFVEVSPAEIRPSTETFSSELVRMGEFYARYGFDTDAAEQAIVDDQAVADEFGQLMVENGFQDAVTRIEEYSLAGCGIDLANS